MAQDSYPEKDSAVVGVAGPRRQIIVAGAGPVLPFLAHLMPGWRIEPAAADAVPELTLRQTGTGFHLEGEGLPDGPATAKDPATAAQLVMIALAVCYMRQVPDLVQVHAAGVKLAGGVVALLGDTQAGKTSVALHLAGLGCRLYADDRLLLRLGAQDASEPTVEAVALCLAPRVRLPLPRDAGDGLARLVAERTVLRLKDRAVLSLQDGQVAARGEAAPLAALVQLQRRDTAGSVTLQAASTSETLRALLSNCLAPRIDPEELVVRAAALVSVIPCFVVDFANSGDAARVIIHRFGSR